MKIAVVTLATRDYFPGAKALFESIQFRHSQEELKYFLFSNELSASEYFNNSIHGVISTTNEFEEVAFNSKVPRFRITLLKLYSLRFLEESDFDRVIFLDSDLMCVGDISPLFDASLSNFQIMAVRDYACQNYYAPEILEAGIDPEIVFNTGCLILNRSLLDSLTFKELVFDLMPSATSYDGGDQGYFNFVSQAKSLRVKLLPVKFNYPLDSNYPVVFRKPALVHFSGEKPWIDSPYSPPWDRGLYRYYRFQSRSQLPRFFRFMVGDRLVSILWLARLLELALYRTRALKKVR